MPDVPDWSVACHLPEVIHAYSPRSRTPADTHQPGEPPGADGTREDTALLERFHAGIYQDEFPDPDERESLPT